MISWRPADAGHGSPRRPAGYEADAEAAKGRQASSPSREAIASSIARGKIALTAHLNGAAPA